jgi:hypothetical protein
MSMPEDSALESRLRECVSDALPAQVEVRLRARIAEFRSNLNARRTVPATPGRRVRLTTRWKLGLGCAATVLLAAALGLLLWPRTSLADVADAVLRKSWIHLRATMTQDREREIWYSPGRNIVAMREPGQTTFRDYRLGVADLYETKENVVYHTPLAPRRFGDRDVGRMLVSVAALLQAERLPDNPLARLDFLGPRRASMRVSDQRVEKVTEAGRKWLDYRLTVTGPAFEQPVRVLVRADAATKLPALCRFDWQSGGEPATLETRVDYPERGPAEINELGVPRTARRIDRVPAGDVKHILDMLQAGRERMDDYRAVYVRHFGGSNSEWRTGIPTFVYRKGNRFRADCPGGWKAGELAKIKRPDQGEDLGKWWFKRMDLLNPSLLYVVRGTTHFTCDVRQTTRPDGNPDAFIVSVSSRRGEEYFPLVWSRCPELACRPPTGVGRTDLEPVLELHPPDGPPGCVRLSIHYTPQRVRMNEEGAGLPDVYRYWLDPQRDYIVVRSDWVVRGADGRERVLDRETVEEAARSPQGVWYATRIRYSRPDPLGNEKVVGDVSGFFVDFDANLPDSLFEPPKRGKIR